jgi:hypothetical protein
MTFSSFGVDSSMFPLLVKWYCMPDTWELVWLYFLDTMYGRHRFSTNLIPDQENAWRNGTFSLYIYNLFDIET